MRVLVLGHTGFVGRWVMETLPRHHPEAEVVGASRSTGVDLRDAEAALALMRDVRPGVVINCAAVVGGIQYGYEAPATIFDANLRLITNTLESCRETGVGRLVQPVSNCAYPSKETYFQEERFWDGPLHDSVLAYGLTRRAMVAGSWAYRRQHGLETLNLVLSNMYGPGDHYDFVRSHAVGALVKRIVDAKLTGASDITVWGSGKPVREWLYVEDGAEALVRGATAPHTDDLVNVGTGEGVTITHLAELIKEVARWDGTIRYDTNKPDGAPHKTVDGSRGEALLGWRPSTPLAEGIARTVRDYEAWVRADDTEASMEAGEAS